MRAPSRADGGCDMITKKTVELLLFIFVWYAAASYAQDNDLVPSGVFFGDIQNVAAGAFNLKKDSYLFAIPEDTPLLIAA
jgi:hypothetical protein